MLAGLAEKMPTSSEAVSIVTPTYNRADKLAKFLAAATHLRAPAGGLEIVVADDGSSDGTADVVRRFEGLLELTHVRRSDRGHRLAEICNLGIRAARHDRIVMLQSDMLPVPDLLTAYGTWLDLAEDVLLIGMRRFTCSDHLTSDEILSDPGFVGRLPDIRTLNEMWASDTGGVSEDWRMELYRGTDWLKRCSAPFRAVVGSNLAFHRSIALGIGGFCERFRSWGGEDGEFGYRAYLAGLSLIPVPEAVAYHQEPPGGVNETDRRAAFEKSRALRELLCALPPYRSEKGVLDRSLAVPKVMIGVTGAPDVRLSSSDMDIRLVSFPGGGTAGRSTGFGARLGLRDRLEALSSATPAPYLLVSDRNLLTEDLIAALLHDVERGAADAAFAGEPADTLLISARAWNRAVRLGIPPGPDDDFEALKAAMSWHCDIATVDRRRVTADGD